MLNRKSNRDITYLYNRKDDTEKEDSHYKHALCELRDIQVHEDMAIVWFPWASQLTQNGILAGSGTRLHHVPALFSKYLRWVIYILIYRAPHSLYSSPIFYLHIKFLDLIVAHRICLLSVIFEELRSPCLANAERALDELNFFAQCTLDCLRTPS